MKENRAVDIMAKDKGKWLGAIQSTWEQKTWTEGANSSAKKIFLKIIIHIMFRTDPNKNLSGMAYEKRFLGKGR